jgi:hypothetical protein
MTKWIALFLSVGFPLGCACGGPGDGSGGPDSDDVVDCSDVDLDGHGVGAGCEGPDCDDGNPDVWDEAQCAALCDADPHSTGCECSLAESPEPEVCYLGPPETLGVGECKGGLRSCDGEHWSQCEGQVLPSDELCDDEDDDCDGEIDDGDGVCQTNEDCIGIGCDHGFDPTPDNSSGVVEDADGALRLDGSTISLNVIWIANTSESTVSKVDTRTREETARYRTGSDEEVGGGGGFGGTLSPSRTSVNFLGDVVVGNRAFGLQASVTKVKADDCDDRGDGRIETSSGRDDVMAWPTHDDWDDDCIAWHTDVGGVSSLARAVAVQEVVGLDGVMDEVVWVGLYSDSRYVVLDAEDGSDTGREVDVSPVTPYGAAIDRDGYLWSAGLSGAGTGPARVNTETDEMECVGLSCDHPGDYCYGITVDEEGDVWCGGDARVYRVDTDEWEEVPLPGGGGFGGWGVGVITRGVAADGEGHVYYAADDSTFYRIDRGDVDSIDAIPAGTGLYGIAIDFDGFVWGIGNGVGNAAVLDPDDDSVEIVLNDCGGPCLVGPYTYSDMTGFQLRNATNPLGEYRRVFECESGGDPEWTSVSWDADVPANTSISIEVRTADDLIALGLQPWTQVAQDPPDVPPGSIEDAFAAAGITPGLYLEVKFQLRSAARDASPLLRSFTIESLCGPIFR